MRHRLGTYCIVLWAGLQFTGCASQQSKFKREYKKIWKEIVSSEAWRNSLVAESTPKPGGYTNFNTPILDEGSLSGTNYGVLRDKEEVFNKKYNALVTRAYFKIIAEAEKADNRLKKEYLNWNVKKHEEGNKADEAFKKQLALVNKRYAAHDKMLQGLKSWNIMSEYRSDDLRFFKNENRAKVQQMLDSGKNESEVVRFLIFQLADLYHLEQ